MTALSDSTLWLAATADDFAGETVTLRRGALETEVTAIRGSNQPKLMSQDGQAFVELKGMDFLIRPSAYKFNDQTTTPLPGDRIIAGDETWVVSPMFGNEPCWRYSNQAKTYLRIHTELG